MIILDFSKAFDKVPHQRLRTKLSYYGIRGSNQKWIASFLSGRVQRVVVDGEKSSFCDVLSGVPQGTVLGPILLLLYINDIPDGIISQIRLFADDCLLYRPVSSIADQDKLQQDLDRLQNWADTCQMNFNVSKCFSMQVSLARKKHPYQYKMQGRVLQRRPCFTRTLVWSYMKSCPGTPTYSRSPPRQTGYSASLEGTCTNLPNPCGKRPTTRWYDQGWNTAVLCGILTNNTTRIG